MTLKFEATRDLGLTIEMTKFGLATRDWGLTMRNTTKFRLATQPLAPLEGLHEEYTVCLHRQHLPQQHGRAIANHLVRQKV